MRSMPVFEMEGWMTTYEKVPGVLNIAETCTASVSVEDLISLSEDDSIPPPVDFSTKYLYGPARCSEQLRERIAAAHNRNTVTQTPLDASDILVTVGATGANFLLYFALINPGDHVICVYPTYQQLYAAPESLGAEVSLWRLKEENGWVPDPSELEQLVKSNTKMIVINNPNNPTGAPIPAKVLEEIVHFANARGIIVFSDEVYRPLFHDINDPGSSTHASANHPSVATMGYDKTIITGSMSKVYSLAGLRVGWIACKDKQIIEALSLAQEYAFISVSAVNDQIASYALSEPVLSPLLRRNHGLVTTNKALLAAFVEKHKDVCSWVVPGAGTTAFVRFTVRGIPVDDVAFCKDLIDRVKVYMVPGSLCFGHGKDFVGYVRIGYGCQTTVLREALEAFSKYIEEHLG